MKIWKYEESSAKHLLVKFYAENHGEGEYLGDFSDDEVRALIYEVKPDVEMEQALGTLKYFGFLPLLVTNQSSS